MGRGRVLTSRDGDADHARPDLQSEAALDAGAQSVPALADGAVKREVPGKDPGRIPLGCVGASGPSAALALP